MKIPIARTACREGVNAARTLFERAGCVFQEVDQQNDYGKDAYVDIGHEGIVTHLCVAVQIKSGGSYRAAGGYRVPVEGHAALWRESTIPVFGLVYDPVDTQLRWGDLTGYLRAHPEQDHGTIPIDGDQVLDTSALPEFVAAVGVYARRQTDISAQLLSANDRLQDDAVLNAWALGRSDARYLVILRRMLLELRPPYALRRAIFLLSHAGSHPDILWTPQNWIPPEIAKQALPSFTWSPEEIAHMLRAIDGAAWGRGSLGQCFDVLMYEDPMIVAKARGAVGLLLDVAHGGDEDTAVRAATIALSHSKDARTELARLVEAFPALEANEWFSEIATLIRDQGWLSLYS